jgi:hypothetical protein
MVETMALFARAAKAVITASAHTDEILMLFFIQLFLFLVVFRVILTPPRGGRRKGVPGVACGQHGPDCDSAAVGKGL